MTPLELLEAPEITEKVEETLSQKAKRFAGNDLIINLYLDVCEDFSNHEITRPELSEIKHYIARAYNVHSDDKKEFFQKAYESITDYNQDF